MPSVRVTILKNSKQTIRCVAILNVASTNDLWGELLSIAKNKLRFSKKPTRVFIITDRGGREIHDTDTATICNGAILAVSAGEDYVGNKDEGGPVTLGEQLQHECRVIAAKSIVDPEAVKQLEAASKLPGMTTCVGMPDLHCGKGYPIGATFISTGFIYPALIGGDIGCGMSLYQVPGISASTLSAKSARVASRVVGLEGPWDGDTTAWLAHSQVEPTSYEATLGTIGGGNHFAELQVVHQVVDEELFEQLRLNTKDSYLLVHSGSRGYGKSILDGHIQKYQDQGLPCDSDEANSYLQQHDQACLWARRNRELIAHRLLGSLGALDGASKVIDIWHNNVMPKILPGDEGSSWIHRKGAAPSDQGPVVIPGSRGAFSYIVMPVGDQQHVNAYSLAHGAGREMSRGKALSTIRSRFKRTELSILETTVFGGTVICEDKDLLCEEAPEAYKDISNIIDDLVQIGAVRVVAVLQPLVTYKMRNSSG
ncbi:tRNA-splicing ligase RtcB-domain-containing protein [Phlyctochytrium arcticum]|nr:tRNA-splicing ligase RtcB-domain-containing protein [Phlyctochytrium arcticum]